MITLRYRPGRLAIHGAPHSTLDVNVEAVTIGLYEAVQPHDDIDSLVSSGIDSCCESLGRELAKRRGSGDWNINTVYEKRTSCRLVVVSECNTTPACLYIRVQMTRGRAPIAATHSYSLPGEFPSILWHYYPYRANMLFTTATSGVGRMLHSSCPTPGHNYRAAEHN